MRIIPFAAALISAVISFAGVIVLRLMQALVSGLRIDAYLRENPPVETWVVMAIGALTAYGFTYFITVRSASRSSYHLPSVRNVRSVSSP